MDFLIFNKEQSFVIGDVYCKYFLFDISKPLIITFAPAEGYISKDIVSSSPDPWGFKYIKRKKVNIISFASIDENCWYLSKVFRKYIEEEMSKEISIFPKILGYGASMGGFGVSAYANILNITKVLLFNPISTLNEKIVPFETRFIRGKRLNWTDRAFCDSIDIKANGYVVYDPMFSLDRKHAERYKNLIPLKVPGVGHTIPKSLSKMKILNWLIDDFITDKIDESFFKQEAKRRRKIPEYYNTMIALNGRRATPLRDKIILEYRNKNTILPEPQKEKPATINNKDIDNIRDIAVSLEKIDINKAYTLMLLAKKLRPTGPFLIKKVLEYEKKIKLKSIMLPIN